MADVLLADWGNEGTMAQRLAGWRDRGWTGEKGGAKRSLNGRERQMNMNGRRLSSEETTRGTWDYA